MGEYIIGASQKALHWLVGEVDGVRERLEDWLARSLKDPFLLVTSGGRGKMVGTSSNLKFNPRGLPFQNL